MTSLSSTIGGAGSSISIISASAKDSDWIEQLQARVFGPGRFARAAFRVRESFPSDLSLGFIALVEGKSIGSVSMTPISVASINGHLLGPLVTDPDFRGLGTGRMLVNEATSGALENTSGKFVLLVGDLSYYGSMGYMQTKPNAIKFPGPVDPGRILVHCANEMLASELYGELAAFNG